MRMHPAHPIAVHVPLACWGLTPVCDALALAMGRAFFWQAAALLAAFGVAAGAIAAPLGALDRPRAKARAARLAIIHASLMATAWTLSAISLAGRIDATYAALVPAPSWAIVSSALALIVMIAGAWCGGEMVYGHGVGVREDSPASSPPDRQDL